MMPAPGKEKDLRLPYDTLTPREKEIMYLAADGEENKTIGTVLGISEETVKRHLSNIFDKVGCSTRTHLAVWWLSRNQISRSQYDEVVNERAALAMQNRLLNRTITHLRAELAGVKRGVIAV
jgi:DNA-binding CsgD family transcriptional regulator